MTLDVLVVGAGLSGLATAAGLQQHGHRVRVLEERDDTSAGAAISLWPNALAALDTLGLGDDVRTAGFAVAAGSLRTHEGAWLRRPGADALAAALGEPVLVLRRGALVDTLARHLTPGTVRTGAPVRGVRVTPGRAGVVLADGSLLDADAVIGADGTRSVVTRHLSPGLRDTYVGYTSWRGIARHALAPDLGGVTVGPGVEVGHVPLDAEHTYWFATERRPEGETLTDELGHLRTLLAGWADPVPDLLATTNPGDLFRLDLHDRATARRWSAGPVAVLGDAAHPMRPHLGQGGCQGLEDAAVLVALLDRHPEPAAAFAAFERFRRPRVQRLVRGSRLAGRVLNLRPAAVGTAAARASGLLPESMVLRGLASVAGRSAFRLPG